MSFKCRCRKCGSRKTLAKHPDEYMNHLYCRNCKSKDSYRVDKYRQSKRESAVQTCYCDGMPYPHRKGSVPFCIHSNVEPTEEDMVKLTNSLRRL